MKAETVKIYALVDPTTGKIRYVGWTAGELNKRLKGHLLDPRSAIMARWLRGLKAKGIEPQIKRLSTVLWENRHKKEREWIIKLADDGEPLLNRIHNPNKSGRKI